MLTPPVKAIPQCGACKTCGGPLQNDDGRLLPCAACWPNDNLRAPAYRSPTVSCVNDAPPPSSIRTVEYERVKDDAGRLLWALR